MIHKAEKESETYDVFFERWKLARLSGLACHTRYCQSCRRASDLTYDKIPGGGELEWTCPWCGVQQTTRVF